MRKIIFSICILSACMLCGCNPADQYPISFKVDGTTWYANSAPAILSSGKIYINANSITQGQNPVAFTLGQYAMVDTFDIDSANNAFLYGTSLASGYYARIDNPAKLVVTQFNASDKHIVADFFGWLSNQNRTDSVLITDGKFDLHYQ